MSCKDKLVLKLTDITVTSTLKHEESTEEQKAEAAKNLAEYFKEQSNSELLKALVLKDLYVVSTQNIEDNVFFKLKAVGGYICNKTTFAKLRDSYGTQLSKLFTIHMV